MRNIGILGGTFNPPHNGHADMALKIKEEFALDGVLIMPVGTPPHKDDIAAPEHRLAMLSLLFKDQQGISISDIEAFRAGYTYTVDTLRQIFATDTVYYYIIGSDTLFDLVTWRDYKQICALCRFICVPRGDSVEKINSCIKGYKAEFNIDVCISAYKGLDISSTQIRESVARGEDISKMVPESVKQYILEHKLYG